MRHERHRRAELLLDLRRVAVREHAVGREAAVALAEVRPLGRRLAGARHARLRVDDDRLPRSGRPAAAAAARGSPPSDSSPAHATSVESRSRLAIALGQAVDDATPAARASADTSAGAAPRRAAGRRRRDRRRACRARAARRDLGGGVLGQREEHRVGVGGEHVDVEAVDRRIPEPRQRRHAPRRGARAPPSRRQCGRAGWRASRRSSSTPGIPGRPRDPDPHCVGIIIHQN